MEAVSIPNITEFVKTETLPKNRIKTTVSWFMLDPEVFDTICLRHIRGEGSIVEARIGTAMKHPTDKYVKATALEIARKSLGKSKLKIAQIVSNNRSTKIYLEDYILEKFTNGKIIVKDISAW